MDSSDTTPLVGLRGRQRIPAFAVRRPSSVADAAALGAEPHSAWMAGGIDLVDALKQGRPLDHLVPLSGLAELRSVSALAGGGLRVGALVTYQELADHPLARTVAPELCALLGSVANIRIRSKATVGGSVMSRNGTYDLMPALLALGATLVFEGTGGGEKRLPADALGDDEGRLLRAVELPGAASARLRIDRSLRPVACVYLGLHGTDDAVTALRLAAGCVHPRPIAATLSLNGLPMGALLMDTLADHAEELAHALQAALPAPVGDGLASSDYRRRMIAVLTRRLLTTPVAEPSR